MLFNSFAFAVFLPLVFALYWAVFNRKIWLRNLFLLVASYAFYGWWDWRFLSLIAISSLIDFLVGKQIGKLNEQNETPASKLRKKFFLWLSVATNIGILGFFKYCNFFVDSFISLFATFGVNIPAFTLTIVLPVGISFYTFQTMSYTIDIYRGKLKPTNDWIQFFAFVSFFPQLVAGPIERASNLLSQFETLKKPCYNRFRDGMLQMAWGFFKKLMIADRLAVFVDASFGNVADTHGLPMLLGVVFFAFQLYCDFSAYSDIAIGTAKLFGLDLMTNFKRPYLSTSFGNFWKRWHISLSSWFQDYVYIPLGGNRNGKTRTIINVLVVFTISGLWHGASWNFVIWGVMNSLFMILLDPLLNLTKNKKTGKDSTLIRVVKSVIITACWAFSLSFFRAKGLEAAIDCIKNLGFSNSTEIINFGLNAIEIKLTFWLLAILLIKEMLWENKGERISTKFYTIPAIFRWVFYIILILSIVYFGQYGGENENAFIYFQF
jgi:D-alanyl-lipoteichoic acid acyltransferase DltB (MBOAT superfamily)